MGTLPKTDELERLQRSVGDLKEELRREDAARTPTAAEQYLAQRERLVQQAGVVEREALKLSVGGTKAMSADAFRSLVEGAHGALRDLTATARTCAASVGDTLREEILSEISAILGGFSNMLRAIAAAVAAGEGIGADAYHTGHVTERCQQVASLPKGNRVAVKRRAMVAHSEVKDVARDIQELVAATKAAEGAGGAGDDEEEEEEEEEDRFEDSAQLGRAETGLAVLQSCQRGLAAVVRAVSSLPRERLRDEAGCAWVERVGAAAHSLGPGATDFGAALFPTQDPAEVAAEAAAMRRRLGAALEACVPTEGVDERLLEGARTAFAQADEALASLAGEE